MPRQNRHILGFACFLLTATLVTASVYADDQLREGLRR